MSAQQSPSETQPALQRISRTSHTAQHEKFQEALSWIAANRHLYADRWVALDGSRLLAVGVTGKEVYAQIAERSAPSLVVRIEDDVPFAGW